MDPSFLLAFPLLLALSTPCNACLCKFQHPQTYYCMSDIVMIVDILGPGEDTVLKQGFNVDVIKILKAPTGIKPIHSIYTPKKQDECGYKLSPRQQSQLLIAGYLRRGLVIFTRCHLVYSWKQLSPEQKIGFEGAYRAGCRCGVQPCLLCSIGCPEPDVRECVWKQRDCKYDMWKGNLSMSSICVPSEPDHCDWMEIQNYKSLALMTTSLVS